MTIALDGEPGAWDVASFDFLHPQMRVDPFPTFSIMREQAPVHWDGRCLLYTSPSPRDATLSRMPSSA